LRFSIIIPVYNRPEELDELLQSILEQDIDVKPEVVVVEDGSSIVSKSVVDKYIDLLDIKYCFKKNSGPGESRNYGMERASGAYFLLLDSDCILPKKYLTTVKYALDTAYTDAFGGPDAAHESFSSWQKAINYCMTAFLTTGGLRSKETASRKFQLRSFNMGLSKEAFALTGGFSKQRIGEDIDLNFKLLKRGCSTRLIPEAFVYHKRRTSLLAFFKQTRNFGAARPILNKMYPGTGKLTYWLPSVFLIAFLGALALLYIDYSAALVIFLMYMLLVAADSFSKSKQISVALLSVLAMYVQFFGYGWGFLRTFFRLHVRRMDYKEAFPGMFA
jgi:glycosyltransferase involved in cell wall biosynthesis